MPTAATKPTLVDLIAEATVEDLQAIDTQIADLAAQQEGLQKQIDSLRSMRKIVDVRINGKPARKPRDPAKTKKKRGATAAAPPAAEGSAPHPLATGSPLAEKIFDLLQRRGPLSPAEIGRSLAKNVGEVNIAISSCTWFLRHPDGSIAIA